MSKFDENSIASFTRKETCGKFLPKVRATNVLDIGYTDGTVAKVDVFNLNIIPPHSDLLLWRSRLSHLVTLAVEEPIVRTDLGNFDLHAVRATIKIHDAKATQTRVKQEIDWFNQSMSK